MKFKSMKSAPKDGSLIMKILLIILLCLQSFGAEEKTNTYQYEYENKIFTFKVDGDYYKGLVKAGEACFEFYAKDKNLTKQEGIDIIDVCANPK